MSKGVSYSDKGFDLLKPFFKAFISLVVVVLLSWIWVPCVVVGWVYGKRRGVGERR